MNKKRRAELFDEAIVYIWEHSTSLVDYCMTLKRIGYDKHEAWCELSINCEVAEVEATNICNDVYGGECC